MNRILLVEDDASLGYLLSEYLKMKGFDLLWVQNGKEALKKMETQAFELAILDVMMPEMDGFTLAGILHNNYPELPFIFLTSKSQKIDVLKGFSLGAIDYLKKPIDEEELVVRINALLSHIIPKNGALKEDLIFSIGAYDFNALNQELRYQNEKITLTTRESDILRLLVSQKNQLCTHKDILVKIWGKHDYFNKKSLNVFITHLRKYLDKDPAIKIENVHGKGFILRLPEDDNYSNTV